MTVRGHFQVELEELQDKLRLLCDFADDALDKAIASLENHDVTLAEKVIQDDVKANELYEEIHDTAILLIAKQQPVAIDLRTIIMSLRIATDIERIADFAENIAKTTIRLGKKPNHDEKPYINIKKMYFISKEMLQQSIIAFLDVNTKLAKEVAEMDDQVDHLYREAIETLFEMNKNNHTLELDEIMQLLFVCRYLERLADHITNIAESVFYLVKGRHYDLNL